MVATVDEREPFVAVRSKESVAKPVEDAGGHDESWLLARHGSITSNGLSAFGCDREAYINCVNFSSESCSGFQLDA